MCWATTTTIVAVLFAVVMVLANNRVPIGSTTGLYIPVSTTARMHSTNVMVAGKPGALASHSSASPASKILFDARPANPEGIRTHSAQRVMNLQPKYPYSRMHTADQRRTGLYSAAAAAESNSSANIRATRAGWSLFFPVFLVALTLKTLNFLRGFRNTLFRGVAPGLSEASVNAAEERKKNLAACKRVAVLGICANLGLFVMQAITGLAGNSAGLIAKAVDSFGDLMGDGVSYLSIQQAHKPADHYHQFGHGKFESLGALSIAVLLGVAAWEAAIQSIEALNMATQGVPFPGPTSVALYGALASIVIKEGLYQIMMYVGRETNSDSTMANASHHRVDGLASVVVLIGIVGAQFGCTFADPVAGILVAGIICKAAFDIASDAFNSLTDGVPDFGDMDIDQTLQDAIESHPQVVSYGGLRSRKMGPFIAMEVDLYMEPGATVGQVGLVQEAVRHHILQANESITEVGIKVVPAVSPHEAHAAAMKPTLAVNTA
jgi:cation diffusion facilitator family transporter